MADTIMILILIGSIALAVYGIVHRMRYGSSCCGSKTPPQKKVKVADRNKTNYPFKYACRTAASRIWERCGK